MTERSSLNRNLQNQLERAALSIPNNIAEGFELQSNKQFVRHLYIAKGSCGECRNSLRILTEIGNEEKDKIIELEAETRDISKQLANFIKYLKNSEIN